MLGLEKVADMFDEIHRDNIKTIQSGFQGWVTNNYQTYGEGWQFYGSAVVAGAAEALYTVAAGLGAGLVDTLRLGQGVKSDSGWGYAQDGLRLITVFGGVYKVARLAAMNIKLGGLMSCTISSSTKALISSGNLWARSARPAVLFNQLAELFGGTREVLDPAFVGTKTATEYADLFRMLGVRVTRMSFRTLAEVEAATRTARGPVVFAVEWTNSGAHAMVAYRDIMGGVRYADQLGRTITSLELSGKVASILPDAMLVHDSFMLQGFQYGAIAELFATPLFSVDPVGMTRLEAKVRQVTGRPVPPGLTPARTYHVKSGDTLSIIAGVMYKDPQRWRQIYDANPAVWGPDPTRAKVLVGQVLTIP
jgi:hypothetical protein